MLNEGRRMVDEEGTDPVSFSAFGVVLRWSTYRKEPFALAMPVIYPITFFIFLVAFFVLFVHLSGYLTHAPASK